MKPTPLPTPAQANAHEGENPLSPTEALEGSELRRRFFGAKLSQNGVRYSVWAPRSAALAAVIFDAGGSVLREVPLAPTGHGFFQGHDPDGEVEDRYKYRLESGKVVPDPASRRQPEGIHGPSVVTAEESYQWQSAPWTAPIFRDWVLYEMHVGTFTPGGTFREAAEKLPMLAELGIRAVEIMPLAQFPGQRNWGYDGVFLYAPASAYGHPDDLKYFVDQAHQAGIAVVLDVVYNHFGPDGNYLPDLIGAFVDESHKTPWGGAIRYGDPAFTPLRDFVVGNALYWRREFRIDGFRLDATHAIHDESPRHLLAELTGALHDAGAITIAEDNRHEPKLLREVESEGLGLDAVWADDLHHVLRVRETAEKRGYFAAFRGTDQEVAEALRQGWVNTPSAYQFEPSAFVQCISNHDQVGNRPFGYRIHHGLTDPAYRALSALLCMTPGTPLFFMGQEWGAGSPFLYFTDHEPGLGALVTAGRRKEFSEFFPGDESQSHAVPDPQSEETFRASKLRWEERKAERGRGLVELYTLWLPLGGSSRSCDPPVIAAGE